MTDKNGKPLKVGDKVKYDALPKQVGTVTATRRTTVDVRFPGTKGKPCHYTSLTLVEPKPPAGITDVEQAMRAAHQTLGGILPEPDYKGMYEDSRELVRKLTRAAVAVLTAPDGIEKAGAYARLRDAVKEAL